MGKGGKEAQAQSQAPTKSQNPKTLVKRKSSSLLLTSLESFDSQGDGTPPPKSSVFVTGLFIVSVLIGLEQLFRYVFWKFQDKHPILQDETNRQILSRHFGVDTFSCIVMTALCLSSLHIIKPMFTKKLSLTEGYMDRCFTYYPGGFRVALIFFVYQAKNLYDTIVWNDGPEFIFHHIMSMLASGCAMYPGVTHYYVIFYLGISEISTSILCILANFDDHHGVPGLAEAFPTAKVITAVMFVISFIICRVILWPIASYYLLKDCSTIIKNPHDNAKCKQYKNTFRAVYTCCASLSLLQVVFLSQIIIIGKKEIEAALLL